MVKIYWREFVALDDTKFSVMLAKGGTVWTVVWMADWLKIGQILAAIFTVLMIAHFSWKNFLRPGLEYLGAIKPKPRRWIRVEDSQKGDL